MLGSEWVGLAGLSMIVPSEEILLGLAREIVPSEEVPPLQMADETVVSDAVRRLVEARKSSLRQVPIQEAVVASAAGVRKSSFPRWVYILWAAVDESAVSAHWLGWWLERKTVPRRVLILEAAVENVVSRQGLGLRRVATRRVGERKSIVLRRVRILWAAADYSLWAAAD